MTIEIHEQLFFIFMPPKIRQHNATGLSRITARRPGSEFFPDSACYLLDLI
jgi:hypothetical protein